MKNDITGGGYKVNIHESEIKDETESLVILLESIINTIKGEEWDIIDSEIRMENQIDDMDYPYVYLKSKSYNISISLEPTTMSPRRVGD